MSQTERTLADIERDQSWQYRTLVSEMLPAEGYLLLQGDGMFARGDGSMKLGLSIDQGKISVFGELNESETEVIEGTFNANLDVEEALELAHDLEQAALRVSEERD